MSKRPYFHYSIVELEQLHEGDADNAILRDILEELKCRSTSRAKRLQAKVERSLAEKVQRRLPAQDKILGHRIDLTKKIVNSKKKNEIKTDDAKPAQTPDNTQNTDAGGQTQAPDRLPSQQPSPGSGHKWRRPILGIMIMGAIFIALLLLFFYLTPY